MNKEWLDCLMEMPLSEYSKFKEVTQLDTKKSLAPTFIGTDTSWLNIIEKYLPFLKNTIDSVYLLMLEDGDVKKNYENRFLYTLFNRLENFLTKQYQLLLSQEASSNQSTLQILGNTSLEKEDITLSVNLTITKKEQELNKDSLSSIKNRIEQALDFLEPIKNSVFIKTMEGAPFTRSPIRRSGFLVTHENYKKLLELSEFLDNYAMIEKTIKLKDEKDNGDSFLIPYFMNYQLLRENDIFGDKDEEFLRKYLESFIKQFVEESSVDEKSFKKLINKLFEEEYTKKKNREKNIQQIFTKSFDNYQKQTKDAIRALKG